MSKSCRLTRIVTMYRRMCLGHFCPHHRLRFSTQPDRLTISTWTPDFKSPPQRSDHQPSSDYANRSVHLLEASSLRHRPEIPVSDRSFDQLHYTLDQVDHAATTTGTLQPRDCSLLSGVSGAFSSVSRRTCHAVVSYSMET